MPYIHHQLNGASICHYELADSLTIGRSSDNQLVIDDATVSGHHAVIEKTAEGYQIRDLDSTNGVFVNGQRVSNRVIGVDDTVVIGTHDLQFLDNLSDALQKTLKIKKSWIPGVYYTAE
ncbi:FHA domain-containing protein [Marinimicrobium sp. ABcell2]|uniref:FHA domain-containing protein n=1 Tax=Marinimicrobium sp. ABcell2 TaxID=3069751 RepID=UPI0027B49D9E|nr:FHA domain-containing protein [Marinimicrobium sp. ABcell2]MDQ2077281.1 FHA domain-containing protein [Marinimicrobium sp. ABcell2]